MASIGRHLVTLLIVMTALAVGAVYALSLEVPSEPRRVEPDEFAVVSVTLRGEGTYRVAFEAPEQWLLVTPERTVEVAGATQVPAVVQVPATASPNELFTLGVRVFSADGGAPVTSAEVPIVVAPVRRIDIHLPDEVEWRQDQLEQARVRIVNGGNTRFEGRLRVRTVSFPVTALPSQLSVAPGETAVVTLSSRPSGASLGQYTTRIILSLTATDSEDPVVERSLFATVLSGTGVPTGAADDDPTLAIRLATDVDFGLAISDDALDWSARYQLDADLRGGLSDSVAVEAVLPSLSGSLVPRLDSAFRATFRGDAWDASLATDGRSLSTVYGRTSQAGRWSARFDANPSSAAAGGSIRRTSDEITWGVDADAAYGSGRHREQLAGSVQARLGPSTGVEVRANVVGNYSVEAGAYVVTPSLSQSLNWRARRSYAQQSFVTSPTVDRYQLAVAGGREGLTSSLRARAELLRRNATNSLRTGLRTTVRLPFRASLALDVDLDSADLALGTYELTGDASLAGTMGLGARTALAWSVRYGRIQPIAATAIPGDTASISLALIRSQLSSSLSLGGGREYDDISSSLRTELRANAEANWRPSYASTVSVDASWSLASDHTRVDQELGYGLVWQQQWTPAWSSQASYRRDEQRSADIYTKHETFMAAASLSDVFGESLSLEGRYRLDADRGIFEPGADHEHSITLSMKHEVALSFATPSNVVDAFGGRTTGQIHGILFIDEDGDGARQEGEALIDNVEMAIGDVTTKSDDRGRYRVRVPPGAYELEFGRGLPASLGPIGDPTLEVEAGAVIEQDIAFAPVAFIEVFAVRATDDQPLSRALPAVPDVRLRLEGPLTIERRTDLDGRTAFSGLVRGRYRLVIDTSDLGSTFEVTNAPKSIAVDRAGRMEPVLIGLAPRAPEVVSGFTSGDLAIRASVSPQRAPPGADVGVRAQTSGDPASVEVQLGPVEVPLKREGDVWQATVRLPRDLDTTLLQGTVTATRGDEEHSSRIMVRLTDSPLVDLATTTLETGVERPIRARTAFAAETLSVRIGPGRTVRLSSDDGYNWLGSAELDTPGRFTWTIEADDISIDVDIHVVAAEDGS